MTNYLPHELDARERPAIIADRARELSRFAEWTPGDEAEPEIDLVELSDGVFSIVRDAKSEAA